MCRGERKTPAGKEHPEAVGSVSCVFRIGEYWLILRHVRRNTGHARQGHLDARNDPYITQCLVPHATARGRSHSLPVSRSGNSTATTKCGHDVDI